MRAVTRGLSLTLALVSILLAAGSAGASHREAAAGASASAFAIKVAVPGQSSDIRGSISAPPDAVAFGGSYAYPADNPAVTANSLAAATSANAGANGVANASSQVASLSLFGGEVTAAGVSAKAKASTSGRRATGDLSGSSVSGLTVLGQAVPTTPNARVSLGDWGYAIVLEQAGIPGHAPGVESYRGFVTALDVRLTADHGGLPAGTEIQVGYVEVSVQGTAMPPRSPGTAARSHSAAKANGRRKRLRAKPPEPTKPSPAVPPAAVRNVPLGVHPKLTAGGYVFPVYGPSSFIDTFGAPRADVSYHHGDDIFAPLGAPLLAVADGTVFSVGWNEIGGNRLWLRDGQGNEFYYAHLSAFSPLAENGKRVKAGEVLGFVGNTGDAEGTPYHLHFEVHPVSLLYLGYDGAVDPTGYLVAWEHLQDVRFTAAAFRFTAAAGWVPSIGSSSPAPKPGAILLQVSDISEASGLDPASLRRAFVAPVSAEGDGALLRAARLGVGG
jgi:murein DD-endopeptidase MepM/ murein hydrolase activator NlpD